MIEFERQNLILEKLNKYLTMTYEDLQNELTDVSIATIRRDVNKLESSGRLFKINGGVTISKNILNLRDSILDKFDENKNKKIAIAEKASSIIEKNSLIYLDAGTTAFYIIPFLQNKDCTVVTNGLMHIKELFKYNIPTILLGGKTKSLTEVTIGADTFSQLSKFYFDMAFLGTNAISLEHGYMTPDPDEASIKQKAIENSRDSYILSDPSKFDTISKVTFSDISKCIIITTEKSLIQDIYHSYLLEEV